MTSEKIVAVLEMTNCCKKKVPTQSMRTITILPFRGDPRRMPRKRGVIPRGEILIPQERDEVEGCQVTNNLKIYSPLRLLHDNQFLRSNKLFSLQPVQIDTAG
jgi:hypothetical protein